MRATAVLVAALVGLASQPVDAQVGLTSGTARVTLVARSAPSGAIHRVSALRQLNRRGAYRELSVRVGFSANTAYRLVVRGTSAHSSRVWVRAANGEYQELTAGSAVTVLGGANHAENDAEIQYRVDASHSAGGGQDLPVRYEIAINPTF